MRDLCLCMPSTFACSRFGKDFKPALCNLPCNLVTQISRLVWLYLELVKSMHHFPRILYQQVQISTNFIKEIVNIYKMAQKAVEQSPMIKSDIKNMFSSIKSTQVHAHTKKEKGKDV